MTPAEALDAALDAARRTIEALVAERLAGVDLPVAEAMLYGLRGGKCLRGFLSLESARIHGIPTEAALPAAAAIECIHAYSLIHDDLPAMDNDALRRGQPTVHRKWDEATAILAGDGLQSLAFELLVEAACPAERRVRLIAGLARAAGARGMVGGQALDIEAETAATPLDLDAITRLQRAKTGALIGWAVAVGPVMAGADDLAMGLYGDRLGLAFQIADDILDVEGDAEVVGKATGKDAGAGKATFVSLLGLEEARRRARELADLAIRALAPYGEAAQLLRETALFTVNRNS